MTPEESRMLTEVFTQLVSGNNFYNVVNSTIATQAIAVQIMPLLDPLFHHVTDGDRLIKTFSNTVQTLDLLGKLPASIAKAVVDSLPPSTGGTIDYAKITTIVTDVVNKALADLTLHT